MRDFNNFENQPDSLWEAGNLLPLHPQLPLQVTRFRRLAVKTPTENPIDLKHAAMTALLKSLSLETHLDAKVLKEYSTETALQIKDNHYKIMKELKGLARDKVFKSLHESTAFKDYLIDIGVDPSVKKNFEPKQLKDYKLQTFVNLLNNLARFILYSPLDAEEKDSPEATLRDIYRVIDEKSDYLNALFDVAKSFGSLAREVFAWRFIDDLHDFQSTPGLQSPLNKATYALLLLKESRVISLTEGEGAYPKDKFNKVKETLLTEFKAEKDRRPEMILEEDSLTAALIMCWYQQDLFDPKALSEFMDQKNEVTQLRLSPEIKGESLENLKTFLQKKPLIMVYDLDEFLMSSTGNNYYFVPGYKAHMKSLKDLKETLKTEYGPGVIAILWTNGGRYHVQNSKVDLSVFDMVIDATKMEEKFSGELDVVSPKQDGVRYKNMLNPKVQALINEEVDVKISTGLLVTGSDSWEFLPRETHIRCQPYEANFSYSPLEAFSNVVNLALSKLSALVQKSPQSAEALDGYSSWLQRLLD